MTSSEAALEPISTDPCLYPEERIIDHTIARARLRQPRPAYRIGDRGFDGLVRRRQLSIGHDAVGPYVELGFGTTVARVYAGGPLIDDYAIEVIEPDGTVPR